MVAFKLPSTLLNRRFYYLYEPPPTAERDQAGSLEVGPIAENQGNKLDAESIRQEDRRVFGKLREICMNGGEEWENLKTLTDAAYAMLKKR